jgi:predicted ATPase/DNA-binding CsgD family transcriptional regulator
MREIKLPTQKRVADQRSPLPRPLTSFVARDQELQAIVALLRDSTVRLLTVTGPGGVGKTRLAVAAASEIAGDYLDGVLFVDLSPVNNPNLVLSTIARSFRMRDTSVESLQDRFFDALANRRMLLVLDNFEQVVTAAPQLRDLLEACPDVTLLVTSRIRLRVSGEREFPVVPLSFDAPLWNEEVKASGAVRLFVERARDIQPDFTLSDETTAAVAEIVRRVDGLPLAIELAAARVKALPPIALMQRMEQRLPLLSGGARDLPLRQQTMRDTIGWSYDLLDEVEQSLFRRLAVFVGGFTLEAAEAVAGGEPLCSSSPYMLDGITSLIEHSLLRQSASSGSEPRYHMLETIREFGWEQLTARGEAEAIRSAHAAWCLALAEEAEPALWGVSQVEWLDRVDRERNNLHAAVHWALNQADPKTAMRLGAALWRFWQRRGYLSEGRAQLAAILARSPDPASISEGCGMLTGAGVLAALQGDYDQAIRQSEDALAGWRRLDNHLGIARTFFCLATVARFRDDYDEAETLGRESLASFRTINDRWGIGHILTHLGMVSWVQGDHQRATAYYEEALTHLRVVGDQSGVFEVLLELGKGACDDGDLTRATTLLQECQTLSATIRDGFGRGAVLTELGVVARLQGDYSHATERLLEASALAHESGDRRQIAYIAAHLGDVDVATGDIDSATARYAEALALFLSMGNRVGIAQCVREIARCALVRGRITAAIRILSSCTAMFNAIGATPPPGRDPATDAASLKRKLPPAEYARAWEAGQAMTPAEASAEALALAADLSGERDDEHRPATSPPHAVEQQSSVQALGLTSREIEVLGLLAEGLSDRAIAAALSISERTAGNHVQHAMQKIGVESRTAAAVFAVRHNLA